MTQSKVVSERSTHSEFQDIPQDQQKYYKVIRPKRISSIATLCKPTKKIKFEVSYSR